MQSTPEKHIRDEPYLDLLAQVDFHPIFIMGDHRSGTTLLYQILVATECFNYVRAYHVIEYDEILDNYVNNIEDRAKQELEELFRNQGITDRGIDKVVATPDLPEEYGFIFRNAGYDPHLNHENLALFTQLCKKIQLSANQNRPLLLKNPWDFCNFLYIKNAWPDAKFIFIHRHPLHVMNSKLKAMRSVMLAKNAYTNLLDQEYRDIFSNPIKRLFCWLLYSKYFNLGLDGVTKQLVASTSYFLQYIELLPKADYVSVHYEDLCKQPEATILKILDFLGKKAKATLDYDKLISPRPIALLPEVERKSEQICQQLQPYLSYHGYDVNVGWGIGSETQQAHGSAACSLLGFLRTLTI